MCLLHSHRRSGQRGRPKIGEWEPNIIPNLELGNNAAGSSRGCRIGGQGRFDRNTLGAASNIFSDSGFFEFWRAAYKARSLDLDGSRLPNLCCSHASFASRTGVPHFSCRTVGFCAKRFAKTPIAAVLDHDCEGAKLGEFTFVEVGSESRGSRVQSQKAEPTLARTGCAWLTADSDRPLFEFSKNTCRNSGSTLTQCAAKSDGKSWWKSWPQSTQRGTKVGAGHSPKKESHSEAQGCHWLRQCSIGIIGG